MGLATADTAYSSAATATGIPVAPAYVGSKLPAASKPRLAHDVVPNAIQSMITGVETLCKAMPEGVGKMKIAAQQIAVLSQALRLEGFDAEPDMRAAGLPSAAEMEAKPWRDAVELDHMMRICRRVSGDEGFGLVVATSHAQLRHGSLAMLALHGPTLRTTLEDLSRFYRVGQDQRELTYGVENGVCSVHFEPLGLTAEARQFRAEQIMGGLLVLLRFCGLGDDDLLSVDFRHRAPAHANRYEELFGTLSRFGERQNRLSFSSNLLDAVRAHSDASAYEAARASATKELAAAIDRVSTAQVVRRLARQSGRQWATIEAAAARIGVSERTLRRRLRDEGTTYLEIVESMKMEECKKLVSLGTMPIKQIAEQAGYESVSNFHRAFKNFTGLTPLQWRERHSTRFE